MCIAKLSRFQKQDIRRLAEALSLPEYYRCHQRTRCESLVALMILLRRLAYPNRWCDLVSLFGRTEPELSMIFNEVICCMFSNCLILHNLSKACSIFPVSNHLGCFPVDICF